MQEKKQESSKRKKVESEHLKSFSVSELVEEYLTKHAKKNKSSWEEDERILNKDVIPVWGDRKAKDITRRDVLNLIEGMSSRGDGIITNTFKIIRRMFRFAVKQEVIDVTPCYAFEKGEELPIPVAKERNLTEVEVKAFMAGIDQCAISYEIRGILKMILLTGQRPEEVCTMHRSEIVGKWWEFTPKETVITKQIPRKQRIYLTDKALQLIGSAKDFIFPSPVPKKDKLGNPIPTPITVRAVSCALRRNLTTHVIKQKSTKRSTAKSKHKKAFIVSEEKKLTIEKFTPHDLRRTCATMISQLQFPDEVVDAVLAHLKKGEIRTYNKNKYDKEKQAAMIAWENKLNNIISVEQPHDSEALKQGETDSNLVIQDSSLEELPSEVVWCRSGVAMRGSRAKERLTLKQLSKLTGISPHLIRDMEAGKRAVDTKIAQKLASVLNIDYRVFL